MQPSNKDEFEFSDSPPTGINKRTLIKVADNTYGRHPNRNSRPLFLPRDVPGPREEVPLPRHLESEMGPTTATNTKRRFTVADVSTPFIGVDFLSHYELLHHSDETSDLSTTRHTDTTEAVSSKAIVSESTYQRLLVEFSDATRPLVR